MLGQQNYRVQYLLSPQATTSAFRVQPSGNSHLFMNTIPSGSHRFRLHNSSKAQMQPDRSFPRLIWFQQEIVSQ